MSLKLVANEPEPYEWDPDWDSIPPPDDPPPDVFPAGADPMAVAESWRPVDVAAVVAALDSGELTRPAPSVLSRSDGSALLYAGKVNGIAGKGGDGKSWIAQKAAADELVQGRRVVYIDLEDDAAAVIGRLRALRVPSSDIVAGFTYLSPSEPYGNDAKAVVEAMVGELVPSLVVIDSTGEALALNGANPNADDEVARWFGRLPRSLARLGPAVVVIDHMPHNVEEGRLSPVGSHRKAAAISGAQYITAQARPFSRDTEGMVKMICGKDRLGTYRRGQTVAEVAVKPIGDEVEIDLVAPAQKPDGPFRPTHLMERVSRHLEESGASLGRNAIRDQVPGQNKAVVAALTLLVDEGFVAVTEQGQAHLHHSVKPYREDMG
ncbi:MAG: AAA family ATPase [Microthrixaceae bacterium]|nr:AAA family ATPase [Microthrixaceae bacterium]